MASRATGVVSCLPSGWQPQGRDAAKRTILFPRRLHRPGSRLSVGLFRRRRTAIRLGMEARIVLAYHMGSRHRSNRASQNDPRPTSHPASQILGPKSAQRRQGGAACQFPCESIAACQYGISIRGVGGGNPPTALTPRSSSVRSTSGAPLPSVQPDPARNLSRLR